jgi:hypothetical protein
LSVLLALPDPSKTESSHCHQSLANRLKELIFVGGMDEGVIALVESLEGTVEPG